MSNSHFYYPPEETYLSSENLIYTSEGQAGDAQYPATAHISPGQDPGIAAEVLVFDQLQDWLSLPPGPSAKTFGNPTYPQEDTAAGSGRDGLPQQYIAVPHPQPAGFNVAHPAQNGFMMDGFNLGVQQPPQGLLSHPAGMEGNQSTALFPANSSQAEANPLRNLGRNKEKQRLGPYEIGGGGKKKSKREKKPQDPETLEYIPAGFSNPLGRPDFQAVHQKKYCCDATQRGWKALPPVDFVVEGNEGIKLTDAMNMLFSNLHGRDDPMFVEGDAGPSVSLRIEILGHESGLEKARQISTMNHKKERVPIKREKLAHDIAKIIKLHLEKGSQSSVPFEHMYLVRLHNVSQASWQPELWYKTPAAS
ncbi:hypothetical protein BJ322DRAFT_826202 [Thelephora terrestris]|uniref:Uncharacterized protein n=1 Tax=Thelephora terrestris TaxID=56493 RepID=A0A9P6HE70_9AGAM|nr:hypothetical protein BJ322DRAFT_826202 [Thelephora terrestris]